MRGRKNSIQDACIQFKMPCYRKSHIRLKEVSNSTIRLVASNKRNKQAKYDLFCIWKGSCKDVITQIQQAPEQEYLLPNSPVFLFTCFAFWKQKVFKISFPDQCLSNAVIYNSEREETFFFAEWNARGAFYFRNNDGVLPIFLWCNDARL